MKGIINKSIEIMLDQNELDFIFSDNDFPETKTQYYYKTHQSATVSIPGQHRGRIPVGPDENETEAYVTKVDTTVLSARKHSKRFKEDVDDDDMRSHLKPFFRTGKTLEIQLLIILIFFNYL